MLLPILGCAWLVVGLVTLKHEQKSWGPEESLAGKSIVVLTWPVTVMVLLNEKANRIY